MWVNRLPVYVGLGILALLGVPSAQAQVVPFHGRPTQTKKKVHHATLDQSGATSKVKTAQHHGVSTAPTYAPHDSGVVHEGEVHPMASPVVSSESHVQPHGIPCITDESCDSCPPIESEAEEEERRLISGLFFTGEYLLVRPRRNALDFAITQTNLVEAPGGNIESLSWETRSGFRAGAGWQTPDEPWQLGVTYTYFHSGDNRSLVAPAGGTLFATLTRAGGVDDVTSALASTNIDFNVIDAEVARILAAGPKLNLKVFGGGRFAWINQELKAVYNGGSIGANNTFVSSPVYFRGAGLTAGAQGLWKIFSGNMGGFGIYARGRGSLVSGQFRHFLTERDGSIPSAIVNVRETTYQIVPVAEIAFGVAWQSEHLFASFGYELSNWFDMVNSPDFASGSNLGKVGRRTSDLTLEALAVQLGVIF